MEMKKGGRSLADLVQDAESYLGGMESAHGEVLKQVGELRQVLIAEFADHPKFDELNSYLQCIEFITSRLDSKRLTLAGVAQTIGLHSTRIKAVSNRLAAWAC